ncbi:uncharacterized protein [Chelonus insularis]|uniref:uncharacterized protein n=1 Tax=Chelonus insularis TaxID=460826 RepID=UPI00158E82AE|nr:uncharacterized protein LOC118066247 [Chelonus insularis]
MRMMNNIIKYVIFYTWVSAVIQVIALPAYSKVIEPTINHEVISEENIHTASNEESNNEEAEVNRSKKSTTFCIEIKSGTPECVPCQPVHMEAQPQVIYITDNNTSSNSNLMNNTVFQRRNEVLLPSESCENEDTYVIISTPAAKPVVSMVQVPVVLSVPQPPRMMLVKKPYIEEHFPESLNKSQVQIQLLTPVESLPINDQQFPPSFQSSDIYDLTNPEFKLVEPLKDQGINGNLGFGVEAPTQSPFLQPLEYQYTGPNFGNEAVPQQHPSSIGSLENDEVNTNFEFGLEMQNQPPFLQPPEHQNMGQNFANSATQQYSSSIGIDQNYGSKVQHQPPFMINQQGPALNTRVQPLQQNLPLLNDYASGWKFANGGVGQLPIQDPVQSQRPVTDFQTQQGYLTNMNFVMGQDGMGYLVPVMMNGNPQLCFQPELTTNPPLDNIHQQSSTPQQKLSTSDTQQSSSIIKQSREIKNSKETLESPEVQTTVAPIKSGLKSQQDVKGKSGPSSQLNHLKGSSSLSKSKTLGKGQNRDSKNNEKLELRRGIKRETEISVDK